jgi:hypothetical protein
MRISDDVIGMADKDNRVLNVMIAGDETWCFLQDSQAKLDLLNGYNNNHHHYNHHLEKNKNSSPYK